MRSKDYENIWGPGTRYPLVNFHSLLWKSTMLSMGKSTVNLWVIFNSSVTNNRRVPRGDPNEMLLMASIQPLLCWSNGLGQWVKSPNIIPFSRLLRKVLTNSDFNFMKHSKRNDQTESNRTSLRSHVVPCRSAPLRRSMKLPNGEPRPLPNKVCAWLRRAVASRRVTDIAWGKHRY